MSDTMDPAKLKVVELREELQSRGLDTKGVKAVLVKRLKEALEAELKEEIPDTSIADTSTEELDTSQKEEVEAPVPEVKSPEPVEEVAPVEVQSSPESSEPEVVQNEEKMEADEAQVETTTKVEEKVEEAKVNEVSTDSTSNEADEAKANGDADEPKNKKSRWADDEDKVDSSVDKTETEDTAEVVSTEDIEQKGEKRKRSSDSPERSQRRRSRTPIKEDEPTIDPEKVLLSWYDSDLHLEVDKESMLSGKPFHDGAFGYAWAGARTTHGVSSGKVKFEVKITGETKWEDFLNQPRRQKEFYDRRVYNRDGRRRESTRSDKEKDKDEKKENGSEDKPKNEENESKKEEESDEKMEVDSSDKKDESKTTDEEKTAKEDSKEDVEAPKEEAVDKTDSTTAEKADKTTEDEKPSENETKPSEDGQKTEEAMETTEKPKEEEEEKKEEPIQTHFIRIGWSLKSTSLQLGEEKFSYGYESTGKFVTNNEFEDYAIAYKTGDVVGAYVNINEDCVEFIYTVNGEVQPQATAVSRSEFPEEGFALFPHVLSRNYYFEMDVGQREEPWFPSPPELATYVFVQNCEDKVLGKARPESRAECEVLMMFGLPGSGKTHWVTEHLKENPDKNYTVISTDALLEKMTVHGKSLKSFFKARWSILIDKLQKSLHRLSDIASVRRRNYILDQTNVFPSAQRRKMRSFEGFKRSAVVVVVADEEYAKRKATQEGQDGKDVPHDALMEMKANMSIPSKGEWLEEVIYPDLNEEEAKTHVQKLNKEGKDAGYGQYRGGGYRDDRNARWGGGRNDYRGGNYYDRGYQRYDRGGRGGGGNWNRPPRGGGGWDRDRRDRPPMGGGRDWRNAGPRGGGGHSQDRPRDNRQMSTYNRQGGGGGATGGRRGGGSWQGQGSWGNQGGNSYGGGNQGQWGSQGWGSQGGGNWNQGQWKYGGGQSGGYGQNYNWNYYGNYGQWGGAAQGQGSAAGTTANQQQQYSNYQQQAWAQYAQQYAQGQNAAAAAAQNTNAAAQKK